MRLCSQQKRRISMIGSEEEGKEGHKKGEGNHARSKSGLHEVARKKGKHTFNRISHLPYFSNSFSRSPCLTSRATFPTKRLIFIIIISNLI